MSRRDRIPTRRAAIARDVDLFSGPGGTCGGYALAGLAAPLGVEWDDAACRTRHAAGLPTMQADVAAVDPRELGPVRGLSASAPCQAYSSAGHGHGRRDRAHIEACARDRLTIDTRADPFSWEPSVLTGQSGSCAWAFERPSTTVAGDPRIAAPGHKGGHAGDPESPRQMDDAIRVTVEEAAALQGFPAGYPFQGTRSQQFTQVGNAVPPPLAAAAIREAIR